MYCPVCQKSRLERIDLEKGLSARTCAQCGGMWLSHAQYLRWLEKGGPASVDEPLEAPLPSEEPDRAKLCPHCGHILTRYRFWPDIEFYLDRCAHCAGVWFDRNEWAVLKAHGLQDKVHAFFTAPWQDRLRQEEARRRMEKIHRRRFGDELYAEVERLRT